MNTLKKLIIIIGLFVAQACTANQKLNDAVTTNSLENVKRALKQPSLTQDDIQSARMKSESIVNNIGHLGLSAKDRSKKATQLDIQKELRNWKK